MGVCFSWTFRAGKGWLFWRLCILLVMVLFVCKNGASSVVNVCACIIYFFLHTMHIIYINTKRQRDMPLCISRKSSDEQIAEFSVNV